MGKTNIVTDAKDKLKQNERNEKRILKLERKAKRARFYRVAKHYIIAGIIVIYSGAMLYVGYQWGTNDAKQAQKTLDYNTVQRINQTKDLVEAVKK